MVVVVPVAMLVTELTVGTDADLGSTGLPVDVRIEGLRSRVGGNCVLVVEDFTSGVAYVRALTDECFPTGTDGIDSLLDLERTFELFEGVISTFSSPRSDPDEDDDEMDRELVVSCFVHSSSASPSVDSSSDSASDSKSNILRKLSPTRGDSMMIFSNSAPALGLT